MKNLFNKTLVFDLDDTLINTQAIKDILFSFALELNIEMGQIQSAYKQNRDDGFTLEKFANSLSIITGKPASEILIYFREKIKENRETLLSEDTVDFLELCKERGVKVRLLTFGAPSWQAEKIKMLGLDKYFHEHFSSDNEEVGKIEELGRIVKEEKGGNEIVLFNDKLTEIISALETYPGITAYLRPVRLADKKLLEEINPVLRQRIEVLPNFRFLMPDYYDKR